MPYRIGSNTVITEGDATFASANASFRNFFYRYGLNPATFPGTVGTNYGYITGGVTQLLVTSPAPGALATYVAPLYFGAPSFITTNVEKFPFSSYVNSVQVAGALSTVRASYASQSSKTAGYNSGGYLGVPVPLTPTTPANNFYSTITSSSVVDSFPFISQGIITVASAGNLSAARFGCSGQQSDTSGFTSGGATSNTNTTGTTTIDSFPFSSFTTATSIGNLATSRIGTTGHSSPVSGYVSGGLSSVILTAFPVGGGGGATQPIGTVVNNINRYPFSVSPITASSVSTLASSRGYHTGVSSTTSGYTLSGTAGIMGIPTAQPGYSISVLNSVERFAFSEQTVTSAAIPLTLTRTISSSGISGSEYGYMCGGFQQTAYWWGPGGSGSFPNNISGFSTIDIFPFASTTTTAGQINMTTGKGSIGGNQY